MKMTKIAIAVLLLMSVTEVYSDSNTVFYNQLAETSPATPLPNSTTPPTSQSNAAPIVSSTAGGGSQTTVVDANGNLKMIQSSPAQLQKNQTVEPTPSVPRQPHNDSTNLRTPFAPNSGSSQMPGTPLPPGSNQGPAIVPPPAGANSVPPSTGGVSGQVGNVPSQNTTPAGTRPSY